MSRAWTEELVWAETADGLEHGGIVWWPTTQRPGSPAVVWVHGAGGGIDFRPDTLICRGLAARGHLVLKGNNRGHDMGAALRRRTGDDVLGGVWWDRIGESPLDVGAWIDHAAGLGHERVVLLGKSDGASKVIWYQAERRDPRVVGLVLASGPTRNHQFLRGHPDVTELAGQMERDGRGQDLLPWGLVGGGGPRRGFVTCSAATWLHALRTLPDLYGAETPQDCALGRIACPILAFFGTNEPAIGTSSDLELIRRNAGAAPRVDTAMVEGMDHSLKQHEETLAGLVHEWLTTLA